MRDYYLHARNIHQLTASVFEIAEIELPTSSKPFRLPSWIPFTRKVERPASSTDSVAEDGRLWADHTMPSSTEDPRRLLRLFLHCQKHRLRPSPSPPQTDQGQLGPDRQGVLLLQGQPPDVSRPSSRKRARSPAPSASCTAAASSDATCPSSAPSNASSSTSSSIATPPTSTPCAASTSSTP